MIICTHRPLFSGARPIFSQKQIGELYQKGKATISEHIKHIFEDGELDENSVIRNFRTTAADGKNYNVAFYNLEMILAIGYRVRSHVGTKLRQWATGVLKEYIIKGFVLDDDRLKNPGRFGDDYFDNKGTGEFFLENDDIS